VQTGEFLHLIGAKRYYIKHFIAAKSSQIKLNYLKIHVFFKLAQSMHQQLPTWEE